MSEGSEPADSAKDPEEENKEVEEDEEKVTAKKPEIKVAKKKRKKKKKQKQSTSSTNVGKKKKETKQTSPRISSKSTFAQIAKELKAKRIAQMAYAAQMAKKRKKNRVLRDEEVYTDKDRAAAVNMGTKDIKQSLKMKKKLDKNHNLQISEEAEPGTLLALGNNELRSGDLKNALNFMNKVDEDISNVSLFCTPKALSMVNQRLFEMPSFTKALELNPEDKNGLVARSKCYLSLGNPQLALKDAETALATDKTFVRAIFQKAEALYHLGDFEHSLMYYHRGHRLRPELECFRLGVQKAQEAIENTIGNTAGQKTKKSEKVTSNITNAKKKEERPSDKLKNENDTKRSFSSISSDKQTKSSQRRNRSAAPTVTNSSRRFLGELGADRLYLENLLKHPDLICSIQGETNVIKRQAEEGIIFLKNRQEFWRQQKPNMSQNKKTEKTQELAAEM